MAAALVALSLILQILAITRFPSTHLIRADGLASIASSFGAICATSQHDKQQPRQESHTPCCVLCEECGERAQAGPPYPSSLCEFVALRSPAVMSPAWRIDWDHHFGAPGWGANWSSRAPPALV